MVSNFKYLSKELEEELLQISSNVTVSGKGIFVAYEILLSTTKAFIEIGLENTQSNRIAYRELLFKIDPKISHYISAVILDEESLDLLASDGSPFPKFLKERNLVIGVKVYRNIVPIFSFENERITEGLDNLNVRCKKYKEIGCDIADWKCIFKIDKNTPTHHCIFQNSENLARFAVICQSQGILPMITCKVLSEGHHNLEQCQKVTEIILSTVCKALMDHRVFLEGVILRTNIVTSGSLCTKRYNFRQISAATITALRRTVPPAIPAVCFSSDGLTAENATVYLNEIAKCPLVKPWFLTFAYSHPLVNLAKLVWEGKYENKCAAQFTIIKQAKIFSQASLGYDKTNSIISFESYK